jgi:diguanylate cyclase (GGDEF)-like protein
MPLTVRGTAFALMLIDLDHFKQVNDTLGHAAGDKVLIEVARRFQETLRAGDMVARLGGDEFLAILPYADQPLPLEDIGRRLIEVISAPVSYDGAFCNVSASIGAAVVGPNTSVSFDDIQRRADDALYRSKNQGRARISIEYLAEIDAQSDPGTVATH